MTRAEADPQATDPGITRQAPPPGRRGAKGRRTGAQGGPVVFRMLPRQIALAGLVWLGSVVLLGLAIRGGSGGAAVAGAALLALLASAAFGATLTTRVALEADGIEIVAYFRRRFLPRENIETATWEGSGGVSVELVGGGVVTLPETGHDNQPRAHAIRAWLQQGRRTAGGARRRAGA